MLTLISVACTGSKSCDGAAATRARTSDGPSSPSVSALPFVAKEAGTLAAYLADSVVEVRAITADSSVRCQGVAFENSRVLSARHCVVGSLAVRLWSAEDWVQVSSSAVHSHLDLAVLELATPLPLGHLPEIAEQCATGRPVVSACYPGLGGAKSELVFTVVDFGCVPVHDCFSCTLDLSPGASGCPLFDRMTGTLVALGVSSRKESSRVVCLTRSLIGDLKAPRASTLDGPTTNVRSPLSLPRNPEVEGQSTLQKYTPRSKLAEP